MPATASSVWRSSIFHVVQKWRISPATLRLSCVLGLAHAREGSIVRAKKEPFGENVDWFRQRALTITSLLERHFAPLSPIRYSKTPNQGSSCLSVALPSNWKYCCRRIPDHWLSRYFRRAPSRTLLHPSGGLKNHPQNQCLGWSCSFA